MSRWEISPPARSSGRWEIQRPGERPSDPTSDRIYAFLSGAADTASFGFGDEAQGLLFGDEARDRARLRQARYRSSNPVSFGAGQLGGALVGGGAIGAVGRGALALRGAGQAANALQGMGWGTRAGVAALTGGAGTAAYGAGSTGDGDRMRAARDNFLPGAAFGGGLSVAGTALRPVASRIWNGLDPERAATQLLARGIQREGSPAVMQRLQEHAAMGRGGTLLDAMDESGEHLAGGAAIRPSAGRSAMRSMIEDRNNAMGPRAQREIANEFGGGDAGDDIARLERQRANDAQPFYNRAYQQPVNPNQTAALRQMVQLDGSLARSDQILTRAAQAARSAHIQRTGRANPTQAELEASPQYWHDVLEAAQDTLGLQLRAARTGSMGGLAGGSAARATERVARFNRNVRAALGDDFRQAQDIYAGASRMMRAEEIGYDLVKPNLNSLNVGRAMREVRRMSSGELERLRFSAAARLRDMIANADGGTGKTDVLRSIMRSEGQRALLNRIFGPGRLDALMRNFEYDRRMFQTGANTGIRTNSHTAPLLSAEAAQREATLTPATMQGGIFERIFGPELRRAADVRNEEISTRVLDMLSTPADEALTALGRRGGQLGTRGGLLRRASEQARRLDEQRRRRGMEALTQGAYAGIGGETIADYFTGGAY